MPGVDEFIEAFYALSTDRTMGEVTGPIPWSAVDRWAARNGITSPEEFAFLWANISAMDQEWLAAHSGRPNGGGRPMSPEMFDAMFD